METYFELKLFETVTSYIIGAVVIFGIIIYLIISKLLNRWEDRQNKKIRRILER